MKKVLLGVVVALVVIVVAVVIAVSMFLDKGVKRAVETFGPQLTQVEVRLDSVSLSLLSGSGTLKGLFVGNPQGYKTPHAIRVGRVSLAVQPSSLFADKVVIRSLRVESPDITFELGAGGNNLKRILANVEAATGGGQAKTSPSSDSDKSPAKKLQVDELVLSGAKVRVGASALGGTAAIPLPDITLQNLGAGPEGITAAELTAQLLKAIEQGAVKAAGSVVTDLGKEAVGTAKDAGKTAAEAIGGAAKGVTDLFKKKK